MWVRASPGAASQGGGVGHAVPLDWGSGAFQPGHCRRECLDCSAAAGAQLQGGMLGLCQPQLLWLGTWGEAVAGSVAHHWVRRRRWVPSTAVARGRVGVQQLSWQQRSAHGPGCSSCKGAAVGGRGGLLQENSLNSHRMPLFFLFEIFFLFKPAAPNECLASHTAQLSNQTGDYLGQGVSRPHSSQPAWRLQSQWVHTAPVYLPLRLYSPQRLQTSMSILVLLEPPFLAGEAAIDLALSQESWGRPGGHRAWGCSCPGPCTGPRNLIVQKQSPYRLIFQCCLHFWPPTFICAGIPLAVHSVPQNIS